MNWKPPKSIPNDVTLNDYDARELRIVKQAILKSALEGGVVKERNPEAEKLVEDWIHWVFRNSEKDKKITESEPF